MSQIWRKIDTPRAVTVREGFLEVELELSPEGRVGSGEEQAWWRDGAFLPLLRCGPPVDFG